MPYRFGGVWEVLWHPLGFCSRAGTSYVCTGVQHLHVVCIARLLLQDLNILSCVPRGLDHKQPLIQSLVLLASVHLVFCLLFSSNEWPVFSVT